MIVRHGSFLIRDNTGAKVEIIRLDRPLFCEPYQLQSRYLYADRIKKITKWSSAKGDLLTDAEVGEDVVEDGVAGDLAAGDFSDRRDRPTKVGRQEVRGETIH